MATAERPVMVTTKCRGVFFGYLDKKEGDVATLRRVRNCIQWRGLKGILDLAVSGPNAQCRIGVAAPEMELHGVTGVIQMTPEAVAKWEAAPWS